MSLKHALSVRSDFSIGESTLQVKKIVAKAKELGYESVALVDYMSVSAMVEFVNQAKKAGIKPIVGATIRVYDDPTYRTPNKAARASGAVEKENRFFNLKAYVMNDEGMQSLLRLLTKGHSADYFYYHARVGLKDVLELKGCVVSTGDFYGLFHHPDAENILGLLSPLPAVVEIVPIDTPLYARLNKLALEAASKFNVAMMATYPALYLEGQADSADVLRAISQNAKMTDGWLPKPYIRDFHLQAPDNLARRLLMHERKFNIGITTDELRKILARAADLANLCTYEFKKQPPSLPVMATDEYVMLVEECKKGFEQRLTLLPVLGHKPKPEELPAYVERLKFELATIKRMNFAGYFLLVQDIVRWAKENGVFVGPGRGSVGGSLVAYLMGITDVDPIRFNLLFERFINPDRVDLPDADLDFMSSKRHLVIERLVQKYGQDKVAGISNYSTLGAASALRDTGRVFELDNFELSCTKLVPDEHGVPLDLDESAARVPELEKFKNERPIVWGHAKNLEGAMRALSQHAAGVVVAGEPLVNRAVVENRTGQQVVNWDKKYVEDWGLIKMDILGLSTLDMLELARSYIGVRHKRTIDYLRLSLDDEKILDAFAKADTTGVFQFESSGMRNLLKQLAMGGRLTFDDLVAVVALFRPGPLDAGLCDDYVAIKQGTKPVHYEHPNMEAALKPTFGVIVYQEQIMQICRDLAGFTFTEADHVRKAMGKKDHEKMAEWKDRFINGAESHSGMPRDQAARLWEKIEVFAGYAFNKSHSVEYVIISWWTMWVKVYYPAEFYAASMTIVDKEDKLAGLTLDARAKGITVMPPDINESTEFITIKDDTTLYAPFQAIKGISSVSAKVIVDLRQELGRPFMGKADLEAQLTARKLGAKCNSAAREKLEKVGAFVSTDGGIPPLHPDRLKDRLEFMPGFTVDAVKADRRLTAERLAVLEIAKLSGETRVCDKCSLKGRAHPLPVFGKTPKFMAVFDCPSWQDEKAGQMLSGDVGNVLKLTIKNAGMTPNDGYYTSLVKSPKDGKMLANEQINGCSEYLKREIALLKPPVILALGSNAIRFFCPGVKGAPGELVGKSVYDPKIDATIVFGLNPAQVLFDGSKVKPLEDACRKVAELIA